MSLNATRRSAPRRRGRQRSAEIDQAILDAALEVLAEGGYEGFTVSAVLARVGVSSATLYRRWPTLQDLVVAAIRSITPEPVDIDSGSLDGDLEEFVALFGAALERREPLAEARRASAHDPALEALVESTFVRPRQEAFERILDRAHERGELAARPLIEDAWSFVVAPVHHRIFVRREPFTRDFLEATLAFVGAGLRAMGRSGHGAGQSTRTASQGSA